MDRFDMEDKLINLGKISEDLKTIAGQVVDGSLDRDDVFAALHGLAILHDARFSEAWDTFLQVFKLEQYSDFHSEDEDEDDVDIADECNKCNKAVEEAFAKYTWY